MKKPRVTSGAGGVTRSRQPKYIPDSRYQQNTFRPVGEFAAQVVSALIARNATEG